MVMTDLNGEPMVQGRSDWYLQSLLECDIAVAWIGKIDRSNGTFRRKCPKISEPN